MKGARKVQAALAEGVVSTLVGRMNYIAEPKVNAGTRVTKSCLFQTQSAITNLRVVSADKTKLRTPGLESERIDMLSAETVFTFCLER
jgi:hypothetical protein